MYARVAHPSKSYLFKYFNCISNLLDMLISSASCLAIKSPFDLLIKVFKFFVRPRLLRFLNILRFSCFFDRSEQISKVLSVELSSNTRISISEYV